MHVCNRHHHNESADHQVGDGEGVEVDPESVSASTSAATAAAVTTSPERKTTERLDLSIFIEFSRSHHGSIISHI
ncbi:unnamed protein product, partial [Allacma fusca]